MSRARKLLKSLKETNPLQDAPKEKEKKRQFRTRVKDQIEQQSGSRHIRNMVERSARLVEKMMDPNNKAPNPKDRLSAQLLREAHGTLNSVAKKLKEVKDSKKPYKG